MEHKEYKLLKDRERFFWWNVGRRHILREALQRHLSRFPDVTRKILDVGCGPGGNASFLREFGNVTGLDSSDEALKYARQEGYGSLVSGSANAIPFSRDFFDVIAALDVVEHIENDEGALREIFRVLKPGGILILTVPAYPWMWSMHDEVLHHKRRYRRADLLSKVIRSGFTVEEASHFVIPTIPFRALKICFQKTKKFFGVSLDRDLKTDDVLLPPLLNSLFVGWLAAERLFLRMMPIPFGSSLLTVAKKPITCQYSVTYDTGHSTS